MGLLIKQNGEKKITIDGTNIELAEIYVRIDFNAGIDGRTCEVALYPFASVAMYEQKKPIFTDVPMSNLWIVLEIGETQDIITLLNKVAEWYTTELGYIVEILP